MLVIGIDPLVIELQEHGAPTGPEEALKIVAQMHTDWVLFGEIHLINTPTGLKVLNPRKYTYTPDEDDYARR